VRGIISTQKIPGPAEQCAIKVKEECQLSGETAAERRKIIFNVTGEVWNPICTQIVIVGTWFRQGIK